ncbi:thiol:disulfide interchange protein DsbA/DsbL [Halomonas sp. ML-15]|uniref:thiol:disulfide interchange protein DsbA/DsbL n=1 Tax=Halomonas sp. ML-15 TaxID=2773305 RepID=UPI0017465887|nr:thiol:disulfide interchange protein DsbA/DsbL [Halomonas sp. ML-15]MBD3895412.1 thiol:disulfide interchange protein DsbA/DsbL [Halomonas sp. ML-15]
MFKTLMVAVAGLGLSGLVAAQDVVEGQHYEVLDKAVDTRIDEDMTEISMIEVTEVFWYGCPHCNRLQPSLNAWIEELDEDVAVIHMPATMGGDWNKHAAVYYAAEELGIIDEIHADIFDAIHEQGRSLTDDDDIAAFFSDYGVSEDEAHQALTSFGVRSQVNQAHSRMRAMELMGVPALVVDGRYVVSPSSAGSLENMPQVADALISKVREERSQ